MSELDVKRVNGASATHDLPVGPNGSMTDLGDNLTDLARQLSGPLRSLHVRDGDREIWVEWGEGLPAAPSTVSSTPEPTSTEPAEPALTVRAPLVGTYFAAPGPDAAPFVRPGDLVQKGQTVAIVEAMKMMNPVVAEHAGLVVEVLVGNGASVEFEQPLISFRPQEGT